MPVTFAELTKQVHLLNDFILEDMVFAKDEREEELAAFSRHLFTLKNWFTRISATNKKRFLLALLEDITSAWTVAGVLLCIWNCQTKDAITSKCENNVWSSYDLNPLDHNRTAMPLRALAEVMISDRKWFLSLEPDSQAVVICELLAVTNGPTVLSVLNRAQVIYERYREDQLQSIEMSVEEQPNTKPIVTPGPPKVDNNNNKNKTMNKTNSDVDVTGARPNSDAQKKLNEHLAYWDSAINSMKTKLNLEESEVVFKDGTKRNIWKVKRIKPEDIETVDIIQLLPSSIGKMIISYLPRASLVDVARVNKYWAYLVEDFKAEMTARSKIGADIEKLQNLLINNEPSKEIFDITDRYSSMTSCSAKSKPHIQSMKSSVRSTTGQYAFKRFILEKVMKPEIRPVRISIRNMSDLTGRLDHRGAVDHDLWKWCAIVLKQRTTEKGHSDVEVPAFDLVKNAVRSYTMFEGGILKLGNVHFPCPLLTKTLKLPLDPPLVLDHTKRSSNKRHLNISNASMRVSKVSREKRFNLWSRDVSRLYLAFKVPSYTKVGK